MIFDAHSDILTDVTVHRLRGETDVLKNRHLARLRKGNVEGSIFVIWVDPPYDTDHLARTRQIMDAANAEIASCDDIRVVHSYAEMQQAKADGKLYVFLGVEGMAAIGEDLSLIDMYYDFGARHAMLTWNEENALATGARGNPDRGLTDLGRGAIRRMEDKRMLVDVSHLNEKSFWDVVKTATKPICASHSNAKALCSAARNLTDDQLRAVRDLDGVVGLNAFNLFVDDDPTKQDVAHLARHAAHMIDVMGIEHVGCGFDFYEFLESETIGSMTDTGSPSVIGMEDASKINCLFTELNKLGLTAREQELLSYENFQNLIRKTVG
ncbi:MAG: membrane dipeptidase [Oscillospiraceae bacterium]